jgi:hypothetical protein
VDNEEESNHVKNDMTSMKELKTFEQQTEVGESTQSKSSITEEGNVSSKKRTTGTTEPKKYGSMPPTGL